MTTSFTMNGGSEEGLYFGTGKIRSEGYGPFGQVIAVGWWVGFMGLALWGWCFFLLSL